MKTYFSGILTRIGIGIAVGVFLASKGWTRADPNLRFGLGPSFCRPCGSGTWKKKAVTILRGCVSGKKPTQLVHWHSRISSTRIDELNCT
jgi:hypothetical protein